MAIELRLYQQTLLQKVQEALADDPKARVMMQLPTGGGKTVIAGALLSEWLRDGRKAVWLTHRKELVDQTCRMLTDADILAIANVQWTPGEDAPAMADRAVILMAQTVGRRTAKREVWNRYNTDDIMIIDEAHHAAAPGWERAIQQWPGPVVGMTATPWRLSEEEGFAHLFSELLCGPQAAELQELRALCTAQVVMPPPEQRIAGGAVDNTGDYTERGIEEANRNCPDIMTAGALEFWKKHAGGRSTIAYAVSVDHARNLASVFSNAGIPAAVLLSDTNRAERDEAIDGFKSGRIKVLVNVIVATEGFDLPDASCVIIARPTLSLALYLQMVGRGLRPKANGGNCVILDLAANSEEHGLPEDGRKWSLEPRGSQSAGEAPMVWCPQCETVSPAGAHNCQGCGYAFGKDCNRCGKWRAWKRWEYENHCGNVHELVCDYCHIDAHIQAHLPINPPLDTLDKLELSDHSEDTMTTTNDIDILLIDIKDELADQLSFLFKELLEAERQIVASTNDTRRDELQRLIEQGKSALNNDDKLDALFDDYMKDYNVPTPSSHAAWSRLFVKWENKFCKDLDNWKAELNELENKPVDKQAIFNSARDKVLQLLLREAKAMELLPESLDSTDQHEKADLVKGHWHNLSELDNPILVSGRKPLALKISNKSKECINSWKKFYIFIVEWLFAEGLLLPNDIPEELRKLFKDAEQQGLETGKLLTKRLQNGLFLYTSLGAQQIVANSCHFIKTCGRNPAEFYVQLRSR